MRLFASATSKWHLKNVLWDGTEVRSNGLKYMAASSFLLLWTRSCYYLCVCVCDCLAYMWALKDCKLEISEATSGIVYFQKQVLVCLLDHPDLLFLYVFFPFFPSFFFYGRAYKNKDKRRKRELRLKQPVIIWLNERKSIFRKVIHAGS